MVVAWGRCASVGVAAVVLCLLTDAMCRFSRLIGSEALDRWKVQPGSHAPSKLHFPRSVANALTELNCASASSSSMNNLSRWKHGCPVTWKDCLSPLKSHMGATTRLTNSD